MVGLWMLLYRSYVATWLLLCRGEEAGEDGKGPAGMRGLMGR